MANKNLLQLVMIVKDAEVSIKDTLESYRPYIDYWCILDTGSTDKTKEIILETLKNVEGSLHEHPFEGFTASRNRALDLSINGPIQCTYTIMPDDTYILHNGHKLLKLLNLASTKHKESDVLSIRITGPDCDYYSNRISRTMSGVRYHGSLHECLKYDGVILKVDEKDVYIEDRFYKSMYERSYERWFKDIDILLKEHNDDPENPRWPFYLGMTYYATHNVDKSIEFFEKRCKYDDEYKEEIFLSYMNLGIIIYDKYKSIEKSSYYFLSACRVFPKRTAESLYNFSKCIKNSIENLKKNEKTLIETRTNIISEEQKKKQISDEINYLSSMQYMLLKEASIYSIPDDYVLFTDTNIYIKDIPKDCIIEAIKRNDDVIASREINKILKNTEIDQETKWFAEEMANSIISKNKKVVSTDVKKSSNVCVFVTGSYWHSWNGSTEKLGGSETMVKIYAEYMASIGYDTYAFVDCNVQDQKKIKGVSYRSYKDFEKFVSQNEIEYCIISRGPEFLSSVRSVKHVHKVFFWIHDIFPCGTPVCDPVNFKKFIVLGPWHAEINKKEYSIPDNLLVIQNNSIDINRFPLSEIIKTKNTFCYTSWFNRGLHKLLEIFPFIHEKMPDSILYIYCDIPPSETGMLLAIKKNSSFIKLIGRVSQETLSLNLLWTEYWIYPTIFNETYCISALEAQAAKCICIYCDIGALSDTIADRGISIENIMTIDDLNREMSYDTVNASAHRLMNKKIKKTFDPSVIANEIFTKLNYMTDEYKDDMLSRGRKYAEEHDLQIMGNKFFKILKDS